MEYLLGSLFASKCFEPQPSVAHHLHLDPASAASSPYPYVFHSNSATQLSSPPSHDVLAARRPTAFYNSALLDSSTAEQQQSLSQSHVAVGGKQQHHSLAAHRAPSAGLPPLTAAPIEVEDALVTSEDAMSPLGPLGASYGFPFDTQRSSQVVPISHLLGKYVLLYLSPPSGGCAHHQQQQQHEGGTASPPAGLMTSSVSQPSSMRRTAAQPNNNNNTSNEGSSPSRGASQQLSMSLDAGGGGGGASRSRSTIYARPAATSAGCTNSNNNNNSSNAASSSPPSACLARRRLLMFYALLLQELEREQMDALVRSDDPRFPDAEVLRGRNLVDAPIAVLEVCYDEGGGPATSTTSAQVDVSKPSAMPATSGGAPSPLGHTVQHSSTVNSLGSSPSGHGLPFARPASRPLAAMSDEGPHRLLDLLRSLAEDGGKELLGEEWPVPDSSIVLDSEIVHNPFFGGWLTVESCEGFRRVMHTYDIDHWPAVLLLDPAGNLMTAQALSHIETELATTFATAPHRSSLSATKNSIQVPSLANGGTSPSPSVPMSVASGPLKEDGSSESGAVVPPDVDVTTAGSDAMIGREGSDQLLQQQQQQQPRCSTSIRTELRDASVSINDPKIPTAEPTPVKKGEWQHQHDATASGEFASSGEGIHRHVPSGTGSSSQRRVLSLEDEGDGSDTAELPAMIPSSVTNPPHDNDARSPSPHSACAADQQQQQQEQQQADSREPSVQVPMFPSIAKPIEFHSGFPWNSRTASGFAYTHNTATSGGCSEHTSSTCDRWLRGGSPAAHSSAAFADTDRSLESQLVWPKEDKRKVNAAERGSSSRHPTPPRGRGAPAAAVGTAMPVHPMQDLVGAAKTVSDILAGNYDYDEPLSLEEEYGQEENTQHQHHHQHQQQQQQSLSGVTHVLFLFGAGWHPSMEKTVKSVCHLVDRLHSGDKAHHGHDAVDNSSHSNLHFGERLTNAQFGAMMMLTTSGGGGKDKLLSGELHSRSTDDHSTDFPSHFDFRMAQPSAMSDAFADAGPSSAAADMSGDDLGTAHGNHNNNSHHNNNDTSGCLPSRRRATVQVVFMSVDDTLKDLLQALQWMPMSWLCVSPLVGGPAHEVLLAEAMQIHHVVTLPRMVVLSLPSLPASSSPCTASASDFPTRASSNSNSAAAEAGVWRVVQSHAEVKLVSDRTGANFPWDESAAEGAAAAAAHQAPPPPSTEAASQTTQHLQPFAPTSDDHSQTSAGMERMMQPVEAPPRVPVPSTVTPFVSNPQLLTRLERGGVFVVLCAMGAVCATLHDQCVDALATASRWLYREMEERKLQLWSEPYGSGQSLLLQTIGRCGPSMPLTGSLPAARMLTSALGGSLDVNSSTRGAGVRRDSLNTSSCIPSLATTTVELAPGALPALPNHQADNKWSATVPSVYFYDGILRTESTTSPREGSLDNTEELREGREQDVALLLEYVVAPLLERGENCLPAREGDVFLVCVNLPNRTAAVLRKELPVEPQVASTNTTNTTGPGSVNAPTAPPTPLASGGSLPPPLAQPSSSGRVPSAPIASPATAPSGFPSASKQVSEDDTASSDSEEALELSPVANVEALKKFLQEHILRGTLEPSA